MTRKGGWTATWGDRLRFIALLCRIYSIVDEVREIERPIVHDRGPATVLLHAVADVPPSTDKVFARFRVHDDTSASFGWSTFDVIYLPRALVDEDILKFDRLQGEGMAISTRILR
jgi:hypothetical protein